MQIQAVFLRMFGENIRKSMGFLIPLAGAGELGRADET